MTHTPDAVESPVGARGKSLRGLPLGMATGAFVAQLLTALALGSTLVAALAGGLVAATVVGLALVVAARSSAQRLDRMRAVLVNASAGQLTGSIASRQTDNVGNLERAVDETVAQLRSLVATVQQGLNILRDARLSIWDVNNNMKSTAEMTAGQAYDVGVSAEHVSESIHVVAASTEELIATVNEIARHANLAADVAFSAVSQSELAERGVTDLGVALERVDDITRAITAIASQTHLLALNASIEAARAGDAGAGFAVVAVEVKQLSKATAEATDQVRAIVAGIHAGSARTSHAINDITQTVLRIQESAASIASAVTQQGATTREIGRVSAVAAQRAGDISGRVSTLHAKARDSAYAGAGNEATKARDLEMLEVAFRKSFDGFDVGDLVVTFETAADVVIDQEHLNLIGTRSENGVTRVMHNVLGDGLLQFSYSGSWLHGDGYENEETGDSYSSVTGDAATFQFTGSRIRFYGTKDQQQGMAQVWIDNQAATLVDFYSKTRGPQLLWESPELSGGNHTFEFSVAGKKHPDSRYFWVAPAWVEIDD